LSAVRVNVGCEFIHRVDAPVHAVVQVEPRLDGAFGIVEETWAMDPIVASSRYVDMFGNLCRRLTLPAGESTIRYDARVLVADEVDAADPSVGRDGPEHWPDDVLAYTLPSRFCPSDELGGTAWELFGATDPGYRRAQSICDWVHREIAFGYGSSTSTTTALDVLDARKGVCRDFAQLAVTFCRAMGMPARYVFGYLPDIGVPPPGTPMDFCAWMEVWIGGRWWTFDPRNNQRRLGRVLIGRGRDALDVAMITSFASTELVSMTVWADGCE
jgi:transglutaminase-like putative cysteine protease